MDGISRVAGAGMHINLGGHDLILSPLSLKLHGMVEQKILSERITAKSKLMEFLDGIDMDAADKTELIKDAWEEDKKRPNYATEEEFSQFFSTPKGAAFTVWVMISGGSGSQSKIGLDWVEEQVLSLNREELEALLNSIHQASGVDELGKEIGPTGQKNGRAEESDSTGERSTRNSLQSTS